MDGPDVFYSALERVKSKRGDVSGRTNAQLKRKMNGNRTLILCDPPALSVRSA